MKFMVYIRESVISSILKQVFLLCILQAISCKQYHPSELTYEINNPIEALSPYQLRQEIAHTKNISQTRGGRNYLFLAVVSGDLEKVKIILERIEKDRREGKNYDFYNDLDPYTGQTALAYASEKNHIAIVKELIKRSYIKLNCGMLSTAAEKIIREEIIKRHALEYRLKIEECLEEFLRSYRKRRAQEEQNRMRQEYLSKDVKGAIDAAAVTLDITFNKDTTEQELRKVYLKKALEFHPDKNLGKDTNDKIQEINAARDLLLRHVKKSGK